VGKAIRPEGCHKKAPGNNRRGGLFLFREGAGVEFHDFTYVGQEIGQAVVAGVGVIFVFDRLGL
jgi:hypothetical protein